MAFFDTGWYVHAGDGATTGYYAVPLRQPSTNYTVGQIVRQFTPPVLGSERCFVAVSAGITSSATDATWVLTRGAHTVDGGQTWVEITGCSAMNSDLVNTPNWTNASLGSKGITLGQVVADTAGANFHVCYTTGTTAAAEPAWNTAAGGLTTSGSAQFLCLGPVSSFAAWGAPHARLQNASAATWGVGGNDIFAADNSAEVLNPAAAVFFNLGTTTTPCRYLSVDHTAALPAPLKAGASFTTAATASGAISIANGVSLSQYWFGFTFIATAATAVFLITVGGGTGAALRMDNCAFVLTSTVAGPGLGIGSAGQAVGVFELNNCTFKFSAAGTNIQWGGGLVTWRNTPDPCFTGPVAPTTAFRINALTGTNLLLEGVDLTSIGGGTLLSNAAGGGPVMIKNCKLHSGPLMAAQVASEGAILLDIINSDNGTFGPWRNERHAMLGDMTTTAGSVRTGGATDGTTGIAQILAASTFARQTKPFTSLPLVIWNDVVGTPRTVTLYGVVPLTTVLPLNNQFWFDVEYMGATGSPLASLVSNGLADVLATPAHIAVADGSTWSGLGSSNGVFALSATFTAQQKGYVTIYPKVGAASYSILLDPKPVLT
jgi:hypothetical protein